LGGFDFQPTFRFGPVDTALFLGMGEHDIAVSMGKFKSGCSCAMGRPAVMANGQGDGGSNCTWNEHFATRFIHEPLEPS